MKLPASPKDSSGGWSTRKELLIVSLGWAVFFGLAVGRVVLDFAGDDHPVPVLFIPAMALEMGFWVAITPLYFRLARRFPLTREGGLIRLVVYVALAIGLAILADMLLSALVRRMLLDFSPPPLPGRRRPPGWYMILGRINFVNEFTFSVAVMGIAVARSFVLLNRDRLVEEARLIAERDRLERQLTEARLSALRMQLNPHFLFNTLHAVSALVDRDPVGVRRMIAKLSDLLRRVLDDSEGHETTIANELAFARDYLTIQQIRFQDHLEVVESVDPAIADCLVPRLILQPLLENAIHHGVSRLTDRSGRIEVSASRDNDSVVLSVTDNGPGLGPGALDDSRGVGLANSRSRLHELYGDEASLALSPADSGGTISTVSVPFRRVHEN